MTQTTRRFARLYGDGSLNVSSESEDEARARHLLNASSDDDDTKLVLVEISILQDMGTPKLAVVQTSEADRLRAALAEIAQCSPKPGGVGQIARDALRIGT